VRLQGSELMFYYYRLLCIKTDRPLCAKVFSSAMAAHEYAEKINLQVPCNRSRMSSDEAYVARF
jgi:hypothetical protein